MMEDVIENVFCHLDLKTLGRALQVCRLWNDIISTSANIWRILLL